MAIAELIARYQFCHNGAEEERGSFIYADLENIPYILLGSDLLIP